MDFILHVGILANALLLYILWKNGLKEVQFRMLFIIFLWILCTQISLLGYLNRNEIIFFPFFLFQDTITISIGPFLYVYVKAIFFRDKHIIRDNYKHFIIPLLFLLFSSIPKLIELILLPTPFVGIRDGIENILILGSVYTLIYCVMALKTLRKTKKMIKQYYTHINPNDVNWLQHFLYGITFIFIIDFSLSIIEITFPGVHFSVGIISIFIVFLIVYLAYHGISQTKILLPEFLFEKEKNSSENGVSKDETHNKQSKVVFDPTEMDFLKQGLEKLILEEKWYLIPELSLKSVSDELQISEKKLSYLLNQHMNVSFYDYINSLRVEEVKQKILDPSNSQYTLLAIALECGFNSKTSFNRTFQRFEGITPSKYKKSLMQS